MAVLVLLPPSEGKADGGDGPPLDLAALSFPLLTPVRERLVSALERAARRSPDDLRAALGLSERQSEEVARNAALTSSPTLPALRRYTGVVYDVLSYATARSSNTIRWPASTARIGASTSSRIVSAGSGRHSERRSA